MNPHRKAPDGSLPTSWAADLADEISNRYELGLSDADARKLASLIFRRAVANLQGALRRSVERGLNDAIPEKASCN